MLLRALVALAWLGSVAAADPPPPRGATSCVAALTAARDFAARLDSALEKLQVRVDGKRTVVSGSQCARVEVEVRADARGRADRPWRPEKRGVRPLFDAGSVTCGERHAEERAHGGFVASIVSRATPLAIVERFKRAVDECVSAGARPKSARRPAR